MKRLMLVGFLVAVGLPHPSIRNVPAQSAPLFRFETDGFWLNLHHFLHVLGRAQNGVPDSRRRAVANAPSDQAEGLKGLSDADQQTWKDAVSFYATGLSRKDTTFDDEVIDVTNALRRVANSSAASSIKLDAALAATLDRAAPIYRKVWWPGHQKANHARVDELQPLVRQHGQAVLAYVTRAYQLPWDPTGVPVSLSGYTNWAGAYSTRGPLVVFSSLDRDLAGMSGLEILFHEAMHQWDEPALARIARVAKERGLRRIPGGITHGMIFFTAGEAVRSVVPGHSPYAEANGLWRGGYLNTLKPLLDEAWKPYLAGNGTLDDALAAMLKQPPAP